MFRLPEQRAVINRLGFNNEGVDALVRNVQRARRAHGLLGINIGKNKDTPNESAEVDYLYCLERVYPLADYITVNISSPNTAGLRELQEEQALRRLVGVLREAQERLGAQHGRRVPMRAEHGAQRGVQQVRGAVVEDRRGAALDIDGADEMVADLQRARGERADVGMELARELLRVAHLEHRALLRQAARVADLPTALGVERRTIEDDDRFVADGDGFDRPPFAQDRRDGEAAGFAVVVADEFGGRELRDQFARQREAAAELARAARAFALLLHQALVFGHRLRRQRHG